MLGDSPTIVRERSLFVSDLLMNSISPILILARSLCLFLLLGVCSARADSRLQIMHLLEEGHDLEARKLLLGLLALNPKDEETNLLLGQIAFSRKEFDQAVRYYKSSPSLLAKDSLLQVNFAEALFETQETELAAQILKRVPRTDSVAQFELGVLLARFENYAGAEEHLRLARTGYSDKYAVGYNLALVQFKMKKYRECADTLGEVRSSGFSTVDVLNLLGQTHAELDQFPMAIELLQEAIKMNPRDERNYLALSKLCVDHEKAEVGLPILDRGLVHLPTSYPLLVQRAYMQLTQSRYSEAESDYRNALKIDSRAEAARIGLALVFIQRERHREATALLQDVTRDHPNFLAYYLLGDLQIRRGRDDEALKQLEVAESMEPSFAPVHTSLGKLYLRKNKLQAAVKQFEEAVKWDREDMAAYYQLSIAYRKMGQSEMAQKALQQFRRLNEDERNLGIARFLTRRLRQAGSITSPSLQNNRRLP